MTDSEITIAIAILKDIRDAVRGTNDRVDTLDKNLSTRIDGLSTRIDQTNERLSIVEHTVRDLATQLIMLGRYVKNRADVAIEDLRERVSRLEAKSG